MHKCPGGDPKPGAEVKPRVLGEPGVSCLVKGAWQAGGQFL